MFCCIRSKPLSDRSNKSGPNSKTAASGAADSVDADAISNDSGIGKSDIVQPLDKRLRFWDLQFYNPNLEREYRRSYFDTEVRKARIGTFFGLVVLVFFAFVDPYVLGTPDVVNQVRLLFVVPLALIAILATYKFRKNFHAVFIAFGLLATLSQIVLLPLVGPEIATNATMAFVQYILFATVLLFQPFRYLVFPVVVLAGLMIYVLRVYAEPGVQTANYEMASQSISFIALTFAYLREQTQRELFAATVQVDMLRDQTERQQVNQINWLRNLSRYLEHELRNHVFIVQSNLEFLQQEGAPEQQPFVRRALRSAGSLSDLCDSVGEASTLESALRLDQPRAMNFSRMVANRVLERARDLDEANPFDVEIDPDLWVKGSESRLQQVFDHLLNNALEYSSEDAFVRIEVKGVAGCVYFTVHNRGEPLPEGRDIFAAFESTRPKTSLGMGLYVSLKIVQHHDGEIEARTQQGQTIVMVTLPQIEAPVSLVEQADSTQPKGFARKTFGVSDADSDRLMRKSARDSSNKPQDGEPGD